MDVDDQGYHDRDDHHFLGRLRGVDEHGQEIGADVAEDFAAEVFDVIKGHRLGAASSHDEDSHNKDDDSDYGGNKEQPDPAAVAEAER